MCVRSASHALGVPKESRDVDRQIVRKRYHFFGLATQELGVVGKPCDLRQTHTPLHAPKQRRPLVAAKVAAGTRTQDRQDLVERRPLLRERLLRAARLRRASRDIRMLDEAYERRRHVRRRQHLIRVARVDQRLRHRRRFGGGRVLRDTDAAGGFDGLRSRRAVRGHPTPPP
jgi:hypothetical protein